MSRERAKILQMIANGTITPEEGEQLLSRLEQGPGTSIAVAEPQAESNDRKRPLKYLRVVVDGASGARAS